MQRYTCTNMHGCVPCRYRRINAQTLERGRPFLNCSHLSLALGEGGLGRGLLEEGNLLLAAPNKSGQDLAALAQAPLGKLLGGDGVGVIALVQALKEGRAQHVVASDVEGPG